VPDDGSRFVLVDDVLTTGGTKDEAVALLREVCAGARFEALAVALDRQEVTLDGEDAVQSFTDRTGVPVVPILRLTDVVDDLDERGRIDAATLARCRAYWGQHGTAGARAWAVR
jgi:orotate phosphoribosyltransferase